MKAEYTESSSCSYIYGNIGSVSLLLTKEAIIIVTAPLHHTSQVMLYKIIFFPQPRSLQVLVGAAQWTSISQADINPRYVIEVLQGTWPALGADTITARHRTARRRVFIARPRVLAQCVCMRDICHDLRIYSNVSWYIHNVIFIIYDPFVHIAITRCRLSTVKYQRPLDIIITRFIRIL